MFVSEDRRGVGLLLDQSIETNITVAAMAGFLAACLMAIVMALAAGYGYGLLLNRMRGSEMMVGNYLNFSVISLMCIAWMVLPFKNGKIIWAMGSGVRSTITLEENYEKILDNLWSFDVFGMACLGVGHISLSFRQSLCYDSVHITSIFPQTQRQCYRRTDKPQPLQYHHLLGNFLLVLPKN